MNFLKSAFIVSFFTLISRLFGYVRDVLMAKYLGTGYFADVFLTAFKLPNFFRNIFAEGAFNSAFVPLFASSLVAEEQDQIKKFLNNIFSVLLYSLLIFTIIIEICMPFVINIIAPGFSADQSKYTLAITLSRITFPYLIFISLTSFCSGILNSLNKFAAVAIYPIILNIVFIIFALLSSYIHINITYIFSYAILVGGVFQLLWLLFFTFKNKMIIYPVYPRLDKKMKIFFINFSSGFLSSGLMQINSMIDSIMATMIPGAVSYIYYSDRISQLPLALIGTAISISILPSLSKVIELKQTNETNEMQEKAIFISLFLGVPAGIFLFCLANLIVPILFEYGEFTSKDSVIVINILKLFAIGLPLSILIKILQTIFYAHKDTKTPMIISLISLVSNVVLNLILMKYLSFYGIVLSTIITLCMNVALLFSILYRQKKLHFTSFFITDILKLLYICIFLFLVILVLNKLLFVGAITFFAKFAKLIIISLISGLFYLLSCYFLDIINKKFIDDLIKK